MAKYPNQNEIRVENVAVYDNRAEEAALFIQEPVKRVKPDGLKRMVKNAIIAQFTANVKIAEHNGFDITLHQSLMNATELVANRLKEICNELHGY